MKKSVLLSVIVAVLLTIGVILAALSIVDGKTDDQSTAAVSGTTTTQGASTSTADRPEPKGDVPKRPNCPTGLVAGVDLPCLGGQDDARYAADAGVLVVNIWAWWCKPCRDELPYLQHVAAEHPEWNIVGVHADPNAANGAALLNDLEVDLPSYQDGSNVFAGTLGLPGVIPITLVVVDGEVRERFIGPFSSAEELETSVANVLA